ncbi:MAG: 50S ribosomal protein L9 [Chloroflexia bacterium]
MKVILTDAVEKLGQSGDVKEVANGYARNFLFPRNLAIPATKGAIQEAANRRTSAERRTASQISAVQAAADRLTGLTVLLYARTGEQNRLYGSITASDISDALRVQHGQEVDRRRIKLDRPIHRTGNYTATITLGGKTTANINLVVEPESTRTGALTTVATSAPAPLPQPAAAETPAAEAPIEPIAAAEAPTIEAPVELAAVTTEAASAEAPVEPSASAAPEAGAAPSATTAADETPAEDEVEPPVGSVEAMTIAPITEALIEPIPGAAKDPASADAEAPSEPETATAHQP